MHWADTPIHFIDFEGNTTSGILEFGVVTLRGGDISDTHTELCGAIGRVRPEDTAIHGIDLAAVGNHAPFSTHAEFFFGLRASGPLAAHFAQAENHLLKSAWAYPRQAPDFARPGKTAAEWGPWIDTGRLYPQFFSEIGEGKLHELVAAFGLQAEIDALALQHCPPARRQFHAALYDAMAGALLLRDFLRRPEFTVATIPWLLQMSTLDGEKRDALRQGEFF